jgi:hypothetical protein
MSMVGFPLLLIPLAIYNILVFLMPSVSLVDPLVRLTLVSGAEWSITLADIMLALGVLFLLIEVIKGARPGGKYLTDHLLAFVVFGAAAAEFLLWPKFGTSTYFLLAVMSAADFLSGVALRTRRGAALAPAASISTRDARKAEPVEPKLEPEPEKPAIEPQVAPAPVQPAPVASAASIAESVLLEHPEPKSPVASPAEPPAALPELQPAVGTPGSRAATPG